MKDCRVEQSKGEMNGKFYIQFGERGDETSLRGGGGGG